LTVFEVKTMHQPVFPDREGYSYAKSLLEERKKELEALRARHESELIDLGDYSSCRRSLLGAINELEKIVARASRQDRLPSGQVNSELFGFCNKIALVNRHRQDR
jgi:hypothetical protein